MHTTEFFSVVKIPGGYAVVDHSGEAIVGYRDRATSDRVARTCTVCLFDVAEDRNDRFDRARAYLARRAARVASPASQMELF